ncbi:MAG: DUF2752 domain-containing protein [Acidobacteria bacterium]|nr:DUF2752 domain-containing protein [Acidobacteriota bacterium]
MTGPITLKTAATAAVFIAAVGVALYVFDPTRHTLTPPCPYLTLTGFACPGCGITRALHLLLHGEVALAFAYNPWAFISGPALAAFALLPSMADARRTVRARTAIAWAMVVVTVAFWIWRNTPGYPFIHI